MNPRDPARSLPAPGASLPAPRLRRFWPDPPLASAGLTLHGLGVREWMPSGLVDRPRGSGDWLLMACPDGIELGSADGLHAEPGPCLVVWSPRQPQLYGRRGAAWCHSWVHLAGRLPARHADGLPLGRAIAGFPPELLEGCVEAIARELTLHHPPDEVIVENLLHNLLREATRAARPPGAGPPQAYRELAAWLDQHYAERITLAALATRLHLSVPHLCAEFRRHCGLPPIEYVIRLRLHRAHQLLQDRNRGVAEVAAMVGYDDPRHFAKLFRRRFGRTPSAGRRSSIP